LSNNEFVPLFRGETGISPATARNKEIGEWIMNKILKMMVAFAIMGGAAAQAALVYETSFEDGYTGTGDGYTVLGGTTPNVVAEDWFGATQGVSFSTDSVTLTYANKNRYRGIGVWLDASSWSAGTVTVSVDVSGFIAGVGDSSINFETFAANGVDDSNSVGLDLHGGTEALLDQSGTATITSFGTVQNIDGSTAAFTQDFTFTYNGTDQYIGLSFAILNGSTAPSTYEAATLDSLTVSTIPEPATIGMLGLGAFLTLAIRRHVRG
jgi:hypothetical protein